jgi:osmotically-inducible protein OsmY
MPSQSTQTTSVFQQLRHLLQQTATKLKRSVLLFGQRQVDDELLVSLIQEDIRGRFTHTAAITITAQDGVLTLTGPVMADEHAALVAHLRGFRGVQAVNDYLRTQRQRGDLPDLQGGSSGADDDTDT